jgi:hypothetical protein
MRLVIADTGRAAFIAGQYWRWKLNFETGELMKTLMSGKL